MSVNRNNPIDSLDRQSPIPSGHPQPAPQTQGSEPRSRLHALGGLAGLPSRMSSSASSPSSTPTARAPRSTLSAIQAGVKAIDTGNLKIALSIAAQVERPDLRNFEALVPALARAKKEFTIGVATHGFAARPSAQQTRTLVDQAGHKAADKMTSVVDIVQAIQPFTSAIKKAYQARKAESSPAGAADHAETVSATPEASHDAQPAAQAQQSTQRSSTPAFHTVPPTVHESATPSAGDHAHTSAQPAAQADLTENGGMASIMQKQQELVVDQMRMQLEMTKLSRSLEQAQKMYEVQIKGSEGAKNLIK